MTFDATVHIGELLVLGGAAVAIFKGGIGMRDAVRELALMVNGMRDTQKDHEERLRRLEYGEPRRGRP